MTNPYMPLCSLSVNLGWTLKKKTVKQQMRTVQVENDGFWEIHIHDSDDSYEAT